VLRASLSVSLRRELLEGAIPRALLVRSTGGVALES